MPARRIVVFAAITLSFLSNAQTVPRQKVLADLEKTIQQNSDPHDALLEIASIGTKDTVPILLERFRLDYGEQQPPPPGVRAGFVCTQVHLVDALRTITNTDQGMYYPKWAAWWSENRNLSQHQWMLNGFSASGLHAVEPIDERFGTELIRSVGNGSDYLRRNAERLLGDVSPDQLAKWLKIAAAAGSQKDLRLGAARILGDLRRTGNRKLLRQLINDPDREIREAAISALDDYTQN